MDFLEVWNGKFAELLDDLTVIFGDDADLTLLRTGFAFARAASRESAWRVFRDQVDGPFSKKIMARDESFFMTFDVANGDDNALAIVGRVRVAWKDMSLENKDAIWKYFQLLVQISQRVQA